MRVLREGLQVIHWLIRFLRIPEGGSVDSDYRGLGIARWPFVWLLIFLVLGGCWPAIPIWARLIIATNNSYLGKRNMMHWDGRLVWIGETGYVRKREPVILRWRVWKELGKR